MNTLFETREAAEQALEAAIASGEVHRGTVYQDCLSLREKGVVRFVAEVYYGSHVWKL